MNPRRISCGIHNNKEQRWDVNLFFARPCMVDAMPMLGLGWVGVGC